MGTYDTMKDKSLSVEDVLDKYWDDQGMCSSCSWHACLYEHEPEIDDWDKDLGCFVFYCINKDDDESFNHRPIKVFISDEDKKRLGLLADIKKKE